MVRQTTHWPTHDAASARLQRIGEQLLALVDARESELAPAGPKTPELPELVDAAMRLGVAYRLWNEGVRGLAMDNLAKAVELLPGDETLVDLEGNAREGLFSEPDLLDFIVGKSEEGVGHEGEEAGAASEAPSLKRIPEGLQSVGFCVQAVTSLFP